MPEFDTNMNTSLLPTSYKSENMKLRQPKNEVMRKELALKKRICSVLNKMTRNQQKIDILLYEARHLSIKDRELLQEIVNLVYEQAVHETKLSAECALLCKKLALLDAKDTNNSFITFKYLIITRCQKEFEKDLIDDVAKNRKIKEIDECKDPQEKKELQLAFEKEERKIRIQSIGNIRFICELYRQQILIASIMHRCIRHLLKQNNEHSLECLCVLLTMIGKDLELKNKKHPKEMRKCFNKMQEIVGQKDQSKISSKIRFMLQDVIDLRANKWIPKRNEINSEMTEIQRETREFERLDIQVNNALSNVRKDDCNSNRNRGLDSSPNNGYSQSVGKIDHLEDTMLGNSTAIQRPKDQASTNGAQNSAGRKISASAMKHNSSHPHSASNLDPDHLTLWQHPITTLHYFSSEVFINVLSLAKKTLLYKRTVCAMILIIILFLLSSRISGPQQETFKLWEAKIIWWLYWVGLGVLSSVGLGTGLHTFVLYLGPHIAAVTMAAYECGGLNFPEPPYPDQIICPTKIDPMWAVGILNIMKKVRVEAMLWGAGTALGELPPYFMARAARISGKHSKNENFDQEDLKELEALEALENGENISSVMRIKLIMKRFVEKAGFWGILACASIPNPLFDLAGLTCGHYLIPFWTFFGATLVGKAVIKMHIQQLAVIIAFNEELLDKFISLLAIVPFIGTKFQEPLKKYFVAQKQKLHDKSSMDGATTISWLFDKFVTLMVCYFLVTIVHALARNHHRRRTKPSID